jgi:hypothetical protein
VRLAVDIVAHTLWAGAGMTLLRRRVLLAPSTLPAAMGWAALPDVVHLLPIIAWWALGAGSLEAVRAYAIPLPGELPPLPPLVAFWSHHLHCALHSALVAGAVSLLWWAARAPLGVALLGWWSHIVIDVFTHSAAFFPTPVFYPFTERGFDGIAWNTPWFLMLNYAALCIVGLSLVRDRRRGHGR